MKLKFVLIPVFLVSSAFADSSSQPISNGASSKTYLLTLTNGSSMPISPAAVYVKEARALGIHVGAAPTEGFIKLCQTGDPSLRLQEIRHEPGVSFSAQTTQMLMPGQSETVEVPVQDAMKQALHVEAMYGKTKDVCAVKELNSDTLTLLEKDSISVYLGHDDVLQTGAFTLPQIPMETDPRNVCAHENDAISCVRSLSQPSSKNAKVRYFSSYLPSLLSFLESKYGDEDTNSLVIPSSGAVSLQLKIK